MNVQLEHAPSSNYFAYIDEEDRNVEYRRVLAKDLVGVEHAPPFIVLAVVLARTVTIDGRGQDPNFFLHLSLRQWRKIIEPVVKELNDDY